MKMMDEMRSNYLRAKKICDAKSAINKKSVSCSVATDERNKQLEEDRQTVMKYWGKKQLGGLKSLQMCTHESTRLNDVEKFVKVTDEEK